MIKSQSEKYTNWFSKLVSVKVEDFDLENEICDKNFIDNGSEGYVYKLKTKYDKETGKK